MIRQTLALFYGIVGEEPVPLSGGLIHQVYRVGRHVAKLYRGPDWAPATVIPTLEIQTYASRAGHPVPTVLRTCNGDWMAPCGNGWLTVAEFAPGARVESGALTAAQAATAGEALARLHRTLAGLPVEEARPFAPTVGQIRQRAEAVLQGATGDDEGDRLARVVVQYRFDLLQRYNVDPSRYADDPVQMVHGDYFPANLLFGPAGAVTAILDWDFAGPRGRGLEIARAAVETALRPDGAPDEGRLKAFLAGYTAVQPLAPDQRRYMFRQWLDYLLFSLYPLSICHKPGAVLPADWLGLARRRHHMLVLLDRHLEALETWAAK